VALARYPETERGRCSTCGFLARPENYDWAEVPHMVRRDRAYDLAGSPSDTTIQTPLSPNPFLRPVCLLGERNLPGEWNAAAKAAVEELPPGNPQLAEVRGRTAGTRIYGADRHCPVWYPYSPGFSPKEHLEQRRLRDYETDSNKWTFLLIGLTLAILAVGVATLVVLALTAHR